MTRAHARTAALTAAAVLVASALLLALVAWRDGTANALSAKADRDSQILAVARQDAVDFTTYDYHHLRADFARFAADTTGSLHTQYSAFAPDLVTKFRALKVRSSGQVVSAGIGNETATTATVLVAVNDTIHNRRVPNGRLVYDRLAFVLTYTHGRWLATEVHEL